MVVRWLHRTVLPYSEWLNRVWRVWFFIRRERLHVLYFAFGFSLLLHGDKLWPMNYLIKGRHGTSLWTRKTYWLKNIWTQHTQVLWYQYFSPMYIVWFATDINQKSHLPQSSTIRNNWNLHPEGLRALLMAHFLPFLKNVFCRSRPFTVQWISFTTLPAKVVLQHLFLMLTKCTAVPWLNDSDIISKHCERW